MISVRSMLTGIVVGAIVSLLVREISQFGLSLSEWRLQGPRVGEALISGALIGSISQLFGQSGGRR